MIAGIRSTTENQWIAYWENEVFHFTLALLNTSHTLAYWILTNTLEVNIVHFADQWARYLVKILWHLKEVELPARYCLTWWMYLNIYFKNSHWSASSHQVFHASGIEYSTVLTILLRLCFSSPSGLHFLTGWLWSPNQVRSWVFHRSDRCHFWTWASDGLWEALPNSLLPCCGCGPLPSSRRVRPQGGWHSVASANLLWKMQSAWEVMFVVVDQRHCGVLFCKSLVYPL